jgi:hypothetical protein
LEAQRDGIGPNHGETIREKLALLGDRVVTPAFPSASLSLPSGIVANVFVTRILGAVHFMLRACISSPNHGIVTMMGDSNPKNTQKKKAQQSAKKVSGQKKPVAPSLPASGKRK